jgi:hypothetical protein
MSLLPLARISKFFVVNYMPNTLVGSLDVKTNKSIKLKGNSSFPRKPSHPRGLHCGGHPPTKKMVPFFRKKTASALSTTRPEPRVDSGGARAAKREGRASQR